MYDFTVDYIAILVRWLHLIAGIAWIGASFYFVWLDNHIAEPDPPDERVAGELWAVHGGGFYNSRKYTLSPPRLPDRLHWFKWEAYWTWISGFVLFVLVYYTHPREYLISPDRPGLASGWAIAISIALLFVGFGLYGAVCESPLARDGRLLAGILVVAVGLLAWGLSEIYSGRGVFIQIGAMIGTSMVANVAEVIIPGQRRMVEAMREGRAPDPEDGRRGKQRSMHNNYLILPVLLLMLSNHWPVAYSDSRPWLVVAAIVAAGMLIRHFVNLRHKGRLVWALPGGALAVFVGLGLYLAPWETGDDEISGPVPFGQVQGIIEQRCAGCHAATPTQPGYSGGPPAGVRLDAPDLIVANARRIYDLSVTATAMPLGNITKMTDRERALVGQWFRDGAEGP